MEEAAHKCIEVDVPPFHDIETVKSGDHRYKNGVEPLRITYRYFNGLDYPISIVKRNGFEFTVSPANYGVPKAFVVRVEVEWTQQVKFNIERLSSRRTKESQAMIDLIDEVQQKGLRRVTYNGLSFTYDLYVYQEDLNKGGNALYLTGLDIVVSTLKNHIPLHPYSEEGILARNLEENPSANDTESFGYNVQIVDSHGRYGKRFINIGGEVFRVPVAKHSRKPDGVYLTSTGPCYVEGGHSEPKTTRYEFEEADKALPLFRTIEEAHSLGDVNSQKKRELEDRAFEIQKERQEMAERKERRRIEWDEEERLRKQRWDEEERIRKTRWEEEDRERNRLWEERENQRKDTYEQKSAERKDYYDTRSAERKETSEVVKFIPAIITGVFAVAMAIIKFF